MPELQSTSLTGRVVENDWLIDDMARSLLSRVQGQSPIIFSFDLPTNSFSADYQITFEGLSATGPSPLTVGAIERASVENIFRTILKGHQYMHYEVSTISTRGRDELKNRAAIAMLEREYHFVGRVVQEYVLRNQHLIEPLIEIKNRLEKYFGEGVNLYLEYVQEPEEEFESLFISILCRSEPKEAVELLTRFYHDWWLEVNFEIRKHIGFTLKQA